MASRSLTVLLASFLASSAAFVHVGIFPRSSSGPLSLKSGRHHSCRSPIRLPVRCAAEGVADGESEFDKEEEIVDESLEGVAKMRASEIKAELEMRGVSYEGIFEKTELVEKLIEARSLGRANPSLIDDFNKENLERKMDPERAAAFADDLLDEDKLKDLTAADGTLPGGMTPEMLSKLVSNPELMVLMQNSKLQEVMKKVMAGGPEAMESLQKDPETAELLQKLEKLTRQGGGFVGSTVPPRTESLSLDPTRAMAGLGLARLGKELKMLTDEPPPGVCAWPVDDCITHLQAQIQGPEDTPYERGTFLLDLQIPERYPFEPPKVRFVTPIYHPNIDSGGRICLDTLKMRPAGSWAPSMNVPTLLTTIRLLMAHPNGDDGLMPDITDLFLKNPSRFADVARAHVEQHARQDACGAASKGAESGRGSCSPRTLENRKVGDSRQMADTSAEAASVPAGDGKAERHSAGEDLREPATDAEDTPPSGVAATEQPDLRVADAVSTGTEKSAEEENDASGVAKKGKATKIQDVGEGGGSSKLSRNSGSSNSEGGAEGIGADASSDDGEWSDSDEDDDTDGRADGNNAKRARTAP